MGEVGEEGGRGEGGGEVRRVREEGGRGREEGGRGREEVGEVREEGGVGQAEDEGEEERWER